MKYKTHFSSTLDAKKSAYPRGAALLESIIAIPFLMFLLSWLIDITTYIDLHSVASRVAYETVRLASVHTSLTNHDGGGRIELENKAKMLLKQAGIDPNTAEIVINDTLEQEGGNTVTISVSLPFSPIFNFGYGAVHASAEAPYLFPEHNSDSE